MTLTHVLATLLIAALVSEVVIRARLRFDSAGLDTPGHRSLHSQPTPHGGGLGIVVVAVGIGLFLGLPAALLGGMVALALISIIDDWRPLPFWVRLIAHLLAATCVVFLHSDRGVEVLIVATLLIAWSTNAYNFMDGADGLAGSMAVIGFAAYAVGFWRADELEFALLCIAVVVASLMFLRFNWHPARIFMGDVGSVPLGFLAGALGWYGIIHGVWPVWFPVMVFSPFFFDASLTLLRRVLRREKIWQAHREHYYQRMVRMSGRHDLTCRRWIAVMVLAALVALAGLALPVGGGWLLVVSWVALLGLVGRKVDRLWREHIGAT